MIVCVPYWKDKRTNQCSLPTQNKRKKPTRLYSAIICSPYVVRMIHHRHKDERQTKIFSREFYLLELGEQSKEEEKKINCQLDGIEKKKKSLFD